MNKIAFLIPIYPPHFKYAENIIKTWHEYKLDTQSDIWFIFTNDEERAEFRDWDNSIVLPAELRIFENRGIINIKKLYAIQQLKDKYDYIIVLDSETEFLKNVNLLDICDNYFNKKELYGNLVYEEGRERTEKIKAACKEYFYQYENVKLLDSDFYLWFNQPCIYKTDNINDFLEKIDYNNNLAKLRWEDFDYYLYMYYLILFQNFKIVDIGIDSNYGICETNEAFLTFRDNNYLKANIYMCSKSMIDLFDNPNLFLAIHIDRDTNWIIRLMHAKITKLDLKVHMLENYNKQSVEFTESEQSKTEKVCVQKELLPGFEEYQKLNMKFKKHLSYFITPFKKIIKWFWQPIPILYNFVKLFFNIYFIRRLLSCMIFDKQKRRSFRGDYND